MEPQTDLAKRVDEDIEDVLATLPLVWANPEMVDRLYTQLVDLLLEGIVIDLHGQLAERSINSGIFIAESAALVAQCRAVGLTLRT